jgi:hypothetical protein
LKMMIILEPWSSLEVKNHLLQVNNQIELDRDRLQMNYDIKLLYQQIL